MLRNVLSWMSPAGVRGRLTVLIFHRVLPQIDPLLPDEIDAAHFDRLCAWTADWFNVLPLDEAVQHLRDGRLPARALSITFDDGYEDNHSVALPILQSHGLTATFFVTTGYLDGGRMWNDSIIESVRRAPGDVLDLAACGDGSFACHPLRSTLQRRQAIQAVISKAKYLEASAREVFCEQLRRQAAVSLPNDLMMSSDQVRGLRRAGMQIGAHTVRHPILAKLPDERAVEEIAEGKRQLESILGERVGLFAYPNGRPGQDYAPVHVQQVKSCGFDAAVSTAWGAAEAGSDLFQLPRFTPWDRNQWRFGARLAGNLRR